MADTTGSNEKERHKHRSPLYPSTSLPSAIERANDVFMLDGKHAVDVDVVTSHWGFSQKSSTGKMLVSALKKFGLLDEESGGKVRLSRLALDILLDEVDESPERRAAIWKAATLPKIYGELWEKWGRSLPSDATFRTYLLKERDFNPASVNSFIKDYKETIDFASPPDSDKIKDQEAPQTVTTASASAELGSTIPPSAPERRGQDDLVRFNIPLIDASMAVLYAAVPMSVDDFEHLVGMIKFMKPALTKQRVESAATPEPSS
jgi:hypothetical protein